MDFILIIGLALFLFGIGLISPKLWNLFSIWKRTSSMGLKLDGKEIFSLTKFYELENWFLEACQSFKELNPKISVVDIVRHHMADGDTLAFLDKYRGLVEKQADISFQDALMLDLSGKNVNADNPETDLRLALEFTIDNYRFNYLGLIKIKSTSRNWVNTQHDAIQGKISSAIKTWMTVNGEPTSEAILEKVLNDSFWQTTCHGTIKNQTININ
ncbi:hypothetical protein [Reichenbachiella versicolor]|uniref:hypothetical protein n=1 Tax=Reichenbachiella versicolor TaxID=1821036 RepID=UPI000D6E75FC|nr:hypothetical protein [Reichenbachiella versicolor]